MKKLYRTEGDAAKLAGVCGGVAEYFAIDPTIVRLLTVLLCLGSLSALLLVYIVAIFVVPKKSALPPEF